jgi:hypothetical protein
MTKRSLLAGALWLLIATSWPRGAHAQTAQAQTQTAVPPVVAATTDQEGNPRSNPTSSPNDANAPRPVQSSTVGNPASFAPLNVKGKLRYFAVESFRPGIYPVAAFYDGLTMANPPKAYPPEWRQGFPGFARNYGDFMASWSSVQGGKFVVASLLHEDPRYFTSHNGKFFARALNAVRYVVIDRSDAGIRVWLCRIWLALLPEALSATPISPIPMPMLHMVSAVARLR